MAGETKKKHRLSRKRFVDVDVGVVELWRQNSMRVVWAGLNPWKRGLVGDFFLSWTYD